MPHGSVGTLTSQDLVENLGNLKSNAPMDEDESVNGTGATCQGGIARGSDPVEKSSNLTFGAEQHIDPAPMDEHEGVDGTSTISQGGMARGSDAVEKLDNPTSGVEQHVDPAPMYENEGVDGTGANSQGGMPFFSSKLRLCVTCVIVLDISVFLIKVELLRLCALHRAFVLAIASCRGGKEVACSVRHRFVRGPLRGPLVPHILGCGQRVPRRGDIIWHRLQQPPASVSSSFPTPTTTAPSTVYPCSSRPQPWPCPLSPYNHQQAQQIPFAAPARSQRFRLIPALANNGSYSRLPRLQPPPVAFRRLSWPAFLMTPALMAGIRAGSSNPNMECISCSA